jgi:hypothetical protein
VDNLPPKRPQKWPSKYAFRWGILTAVILALAVYFGPQTITYYRLRPMLFRPNDAPPRGWSSVPHPLADTATTIADGTTLSYYGYTFEVPWKEIERERNEGNTIEVLFKTGQEIKFNNPGYFNSNPITSFSVQEDQNSFRRAFGTGVHQSKYEQFEAVISVTPSSLSPLRSHTDFARIQTLLEIKGTWFEHSAAPSDIFSFETKDYRGFETSGLPHGWQNVVLHLFDRRDQHWFTILIAGNDRAGVKLKQAEVNRVLGSFREAPSSQPNPPPTTAR